jgi:hypothetical protein
MFLTKVFLQQTPSPPHSAKQNSRFHTLGHHVLGEEQPVKGSLQGGIQVKALASM